VSNTLSLEQVPPFLRRVGAGNARLPLGPSAFAFALNSCGSTLNTTGPALRDLAGCAATVPNLFGKGGSEAETPLPFLPTSFPICAVFSLSVRLLGPGDWNLKTGVRKHMWVRVPPPPFPFNNKELAGFAIRTVTRASIDMVTVFHEIPENMCSCGPVLAGEAAGDPGVNNVLVTDS